MEKAVKSAVEEFKRYRYPEADVNVVSLTKEILKVKFSGHFCETCGFYDYFDDFVIFLEEKGVKVTRKSVMETDNGAMVEFRIKSTKP